MKPTPEPAPAEELAPGALVAVAPASPPVAFTEVPATASLETEPTPPPPIATAPEPEPEPEPTPEPEPEPPVSKGPRPPRRRPTWREVTEVASPPPVVEAPPDELARNEPNPPPSESAPTPTTAPAPSRSPAEDRPIFCHYDAKHRRIEDFRLSDPQGRLVRFQELDADLVLLDFWGTWCQPCIKSVPHLIDLQKRMGTKKLKVVGIACEQAAPEKRAAIVAATSRKLGINYPVLVSGSDGACPLQEALHIQAYPTLILVDRAGRLLWQDQGATPMTLARLDRMLTRSLPPERRAF